MRSSGRATPSRRRDKIEAPRVQQTPAEIHLKSAGTCPNNRGQLCLINIPFTRIARDDEVLIHPLAAYGLFGLWPEFRRLRSETIVAVNVGGCLIPVGLALYELVHLAVVDRPALWVLIPIDGAPLKPDEGAPPR